MVCAVVLDDTNSLRPLTKEALLFLLHYGSAHACGRGEGVRRRAVNDIIANMISQFKKTHVKQLYRLKREFEEEDWEMLNANTKYVPYIICPVCATTSRVRQTPENTCRINTRETHVQQTPENLTYRVASS